MEYKYCVSCQISVSRKVSFLLSQRDLHVWPEVSCDVKAHSSHYRMIIKRKEKFLYYHTHILFPWTGFN